MRRCVTDNYLYLKPGSEGIMVLSAASLIGGQGGFGQGLGTFFLIDWPSASREFSVTKKWGWFVKSHTWPEAGII